MRISTFAAHHGVGPCAEPRTVLDRQAEQLGDDDERQRLRDVLDEVALAARRHTIDQLARETANVLHELADARRREPAAHQAALACVLGIVD